MDIAPQINAKRIAGLLAALGASACVYALLCKKSHMDIAGLWHVWQGADWFFLSCVLLFSMAVHVFAGADKLWRVLAAADFRAPYWEVLKVRLGAGPLRLLLPVDAGEVMIILFFKRYNKMPVADASGACIFDRGLNFLGMIFWLIMGLVLLSQETGQTVPKALSAVFVGLAYGLFLFASPIHKFLISTGGRIHSKIGEFVKGVLGPFSRFTARQKIFFCLYGIIYQARPLIVCYLLFLALGVHPEPGAFLAYTTLVMFAGHLPTAAGVGPREAALMLLFSGQAPVGTLFAVGAAMSLFVHIIPMAAGLPWLHWFLKGIAAGPEK